MTGATVPSLLGGRYQLGALLGYGGMAEVFRGRDVRLGRDVAVKVLHADLARDPAFLSRFRQEAQSAAGLSHPAIVAVYDTGEDIVGDSPGDHRVPYIVMEYVEGRTLREVVQTEGRLQPRRACEIVAEVCAALACSHDSGVVHRDIKPANVMITRAGTVKVMDFGIARAVTASSSAVTQTAAVMGTAQYLSPEQARGEHVDTRSDVYSTGCLLYELLTGQPPFRGDSPVAVAYQHVREEPVPPSRLDPAIPSDIDTVVLKAMAKDPADRYATAADFQADLERAAAGRRVVATPLLPQGPPTAVLSTRALATPVVATPVQTTVLAPAGSPQRRGRRGLAYALLALAVVGIFVIAALSVRALLDRGQGAKVKTPAVIGQQLADAERILKQSGLVLGQVKRVGQRDTKIPKDQVLSQVPSEGLSLGRGQAVDLMVSDGQITVQVPAVLRQNVDDAKKSIEAAGLKVGKVDTIIADQSVAVGTVLGVGPVDGTSVPIGSTVSLRVVGDQAKVPDVRGLGETDALNQLRAAGFSSGNRRLQSSDSQAPGTLISTSLGTGPATRGATFDYVVAVATPPPSPPPPPPSTTPPAARTTAPTATTPPSTTTPPTVAPPATTPAAGPPTAVTTQPTTQPVPTTAAPTP